MSRKDFLAYLAVGLLLLIILGYLIIQNDWTVFQKISFFDLSVSFLLAIVLFFLSGLQYWYLLRQKNQVSLTWPDILLLPIVRNLWSYIIPFQGAFIYMVAFLKAKYYVRVFESVAINIYIYLISLIITGIIGLFFVITRSMYFSLLAWISFAFVLSPAAIAVAAFVLDKTPSNWIEKNWWLKKTRDFVSRIVGGIRELWQDKTLTTMIFFLNILHIIVSVIWYHWAATSLGLSIPFISIVLLTLMIRASLIFKITPGNWGVEQLISGGVLILLQGNLVDGISISLFTNLTVLVLISMIGSLATLYNLRFFKVKDMFSLIRMLRSAPEQNPNNVDHH